MEQVKVCENETIVEDKDLRKITEAYKKMNPINRCFIVSASSMLLASQNGSDDTEEEKGVI